MHIARKLIVCLAVAASLIMAAVLSEASTGGRSEHRPRAPRAIPYIDSTHYLWLRLNRPLRPVHGEELDAPTQITLWPMIRDCGKTPAEDVLWIWRHGRGGSERFAVRRGALRAAVGPVKADQRKMAWLTGRGSSCEGASRGDGSGK